MRKFSFVKKISGILPVFLALFFASCSFFEDSWNEPVKEYFKEYTETSAVTDYKVISGSYRNVDGKVYVSSAQDFSVQLFLRNPQKYVFPADCIKLTFPDFDKDAAEEKFGSTIDTSVISVAQDESDSSILLLNFPSEFLVLAETGFNISPEVRLFHPVSKADFGSYKDFPAFCNSVPPLIFGAVVYKDSASGKYVVFFNMPSKGLLSGIHSDIKSVSVNGEKTSVLLNTDGTFEFENDSFKAGDDSSSYDVSSASFVEYGQAAYFLTDDILTDDVIIYSICLEDEAGFSSAVQTSVESVRLESVVVTDLNGSILPSVGVVSQDENSSYATITLTPAQTASDSSDTSDSIVVYELYQGSDDTGKVLLSGKNEGGSIVLKIPAGKVFLRVYSHKDLYADSIPKEFGIQVLKSMLYVSPNGNDTTNSGSEDSPFATIAKTFSDEGFSDITVLGTVQLAGSIQEDVELSVANANVVINGKGNSVSSLKMSAASGKLQTNKLDVTGGVAVENGELCFSGGTLSGDITVSGGTLLLKDCSVGGKINYAGGKLILEGSTTVSGNIELGGDSLLIYVKNLTAQKVAGISGVDSRSKGYEVLVSYDGDEKSMGETCTRFVLDSEKWTLTADSSGKKGILAISGGSIVVQEYTLTFSAEDSVQAGESFTVSVTVTDSDGNTVQPSDSDFTNWNLKLFNHGAETGAESSAKVITTGSDWPADSYWLFVSVEFKGSAYSSVLDVQIK